MPRKAEWIEQLPTALEELRAFPAPVVDRAIVQKVLRLHRRTAIRLLRRCGGYQVGKTFLIDRLAFIGRLEEIAAGDDITAELARRSRLTDELNRTRLLAPSRKVRIASAPDVRERSTDRHGRFFPISLSHPC
jgi:hypothetical protein